MPARETIRSKYSWQVIVLLISGVLFFSSDVSLAKTPTVKSGLTYFYQPKPVSLTGIIKTVTFPGPPNYEDIKTGDRAEECLILFLNSPISVVPKSDKEDFHDPEHGIRKIQLVVYSERKIKVIEQKRVNVTGTFFHRHTGHHHTEVLLEVERIEETK